jgi:UDP-N-acetylglucosamine 1-carboxyvinyltransferase
MGCAVTEEENVIRLRAPKRLRALRMLKTQPYPGFPTDMQSQMGAVCCAAKGTSVIVETVFENRFAYAQELLRMGAQLNIDGRTLIIRGGSALSGAGRAADLLLV